MAEKTTGFTFLLWNGKYGDEANFVVRNNANNKQSFFAPSNTKDVTWVGADLTKDNSVQGWEDFDNETVDNLDEVVF